MRICWHKRPRELKCIALAQGRIAFVLEVDLQGREPVGRRQTSKEVRELIFRMVAENPTWGAPRIHGELFMLGFDVSERTRSEFGEAHPPLEPLLAAGVRDNGVWSNSYDATNQSQKIASTLFCC